LSATATRIADKLISAAETAATGDPPAADRLYGALAVKVDFSSGSLDAQFRSDLSRRVNNASRSQRAAPGIAGDFGQGCPEAEKPMLAACP
jgi:hypothetical protein